MLSMLFANEQVSPGFKEQLSRRLAPALIGAAILFAALAVMAAKPAHAQGTGTDTTREDCYLQNGDDCADKETLPTTGQFHDLSDRKNADGSTPTSPVSQHHANVRLTQDTFVYAHNICRWVGNDATKGRSVFIGLETKNEWVSFINNQPAGSAIEYCCQPVTVSVCGTSKSIGFGKAGATAGPYTGGYNFQATYRCTAGNVSGSGPTADTSWVASTSGSCAAPPPPKNNCNGGIFGHTKDQDNCNSNPGSGSDDHEPGGSAVGGDRDPRNGNSDEGGMGGGGGGTGGQP